VDYDKQREQLQRGADVIIATPGRLIDYVKQHKVVSLHACEMCVLDEADRMFDLGFIKDIRFLLRRMPVRTERQTLLFSATLSHRVLELAYEHMNEPEKLVVETEFITAAKVRQKLYFPADDEKLPLLIGLLSRSEGARTMVFVNTKAFVERVARALERGGYRVGVLSGDVPQKKRESLLKKFQKGQLEILVATDVAARGLHIDGVIARLQLRPAVRCRGLRAPHRPHRAPGRRRRRDQLRLRALRDRPARHRGLHRAEDPGRGDDAGTAGGAAAATARRA
jgi:ATP-dependent RNA helicase RhlB